MKAYYYETDAENGILLTKDDRWVGFPNIINGVEVCREALDRITEDFTDYAFDDDDFEDEFEAADIKGYDVNKAIGSKRYTGLIYQA